MLDGVKKKQVAERNVGNKKKSRIGMETRTKKKEEIKDGKTIPIQEHVREGVSEALELNVD